MMKRILPILLAVAVLLTACGTEQGTPTLSPADVEGTAVSAAWTMVAQTQIAIPTATQLPPTEVPSPTPLPTLTPVQQLVLPTITLPPVLPTSTTSASTGTCDGPLDMGEAGPTKNVRIENTMKTQVNLSLTLYVPNAFGQCGSIGFVINKNEKRQIGIPSGSWFAYGWVLNPPSTAQGQFYIGPSKTQDLLRLIIKPDVIIWVGP